MLYLIGGVARAGKSTVAEAFMRTAGVPYLGIDYIKMAFSKAMPQLGIDPEADDRDTARQLWPFVEAMAKTMIENDQDYTLETDRKVSEIKKYRGIGDDWLQDASDAELSAFVNHAKDVSCVLRANCEALGPAYFDSANDFQRTIGDVVAYLGGDR